MMKWKNEGVELKGEEGRGEKHKKGKNKFRKKGWWDKGNDGKCGT